MPLPLPAPDGLQLRDHSFQTDHETRTRLYGEYSCFIIFRARARERVEISTVNDWQDFAHAATPRPRSSELRFSETGSGSTGIAVMVS